MLSVDRIDLFYGAAQALRSVSLKTEAGRILCVLGQRRGQIIAPARHHRPRSSKTSGGRPLAVMDRGAVVLSGARETMNEGDVRRWLTV